MQEPKGDYISKRNLANKGHKHARFHVFTKVGSYIRLYRVCFYAFVHRIGKVCVLVCVCVIMYSCLHVSVCMRVDI